ncbi:MAG: EamA family transporter [Bacillales bacterium]|jgi:drug/metabolite transporter (DMT)-like permease|nr:EamA family transporter [Bacillales bacterium]
MSAQKWFSSSIGIIATLTFTTFLWGSAFPFIKLSYTALDINKQDIWEQVIFASYRFFIAALMLLAFFVLRKNDMRPRTKFIGKLSILGFHQTFLQYLLFYIGLSYSTGVQGSVIAGSSSFFQILLAIIMFSEKIDYRKTLGLILGFFGVITVNITKDFSSISFGFGEWLLVGSMIANAYGSLYAKKLCQVIDVGVVTFYQMFIGSIALFILGCFGSNPFPFTWDLNALFMLLYLAGLSAVGFLLWNYVMKYNTVGKVSMYLFLIPVFGVLLSGLILGEELNLTALLGLILVVSGIITVNKTSTSQQVQHSHKV